MQYGAAENLDGGLTAVTSRLPRTWGLAIFWILVAVIAALDLSLAGKANLGALYMMPLMLGAQQCRRRGSILGIALLLVLLSYAALAVSYMGHWPALTDTAFRFRLFNRCFVGLALATAALLIVFYLRMRDYWLARQAALAPSDAEISLLLQLFQMLEDIVALSLGVVLSAAALGLDLIMPNTVNVPILYLVPLAVIAITRRRWLLWGSVLLLLGFSYLGYSYGPPPPPNLGPQLTPDVVLRNRTIAGVALVAAAGLFHLTTFSRSAGPK